MLPEAVFDVDRVLGRVARERVTVLPGSPTLYQAILDHPARGSHDLSSLRVAVTGAADIPVELIRRMDQELPFSTIITGYGLTEAGTAVATDPGDDVETIATPVRVSRSASPTTPGSTCPTESRVRWCCAAAASCSATSTIPRRRGRRSPPTGGCAPATSG
jgi:acyl-CoA synthetase (AMP-forming)/AMP-acid ligase II